MNKITQILTLTAALVFITSCSSDNDDDDGMPSKNSVTLNMEIASSKLKNLEVGDIIYLKYTIEGLKIDSLAEYYIEPIGENESMHQIVGTDYYPGGVFNPSGIIYVNSNSGLFELQIAKPGNFRLQFALNEYKDGKKTQLAVTPALNESGEIAFNAVRIVAYTYFRQTDGGGLDRPDFNRYHKLYIDTGKYNNDTYLQGTDLTVYLSNNKVTSSELPALASFPINTTLDFSKVVHYKGRGNGPTPYSKIDKLEFKTTINGIPTYVEYNNIPVTNYGEKGSWGDSGNPNP